MENPGLHKQVFNIHTTEPYYREYYKLLDEQGIKDYYRPKIKVTLTLKDTQKVESGFQFHFKNELKFVPENIVSFYTDHLLIALQAFNMDEVVHYKIEGTNV